MDVKLASGELDSSSGVATHSQPHVGKPLWLSGPRFPHLESAGPAFNRFRAPLLLKDFLILSKIQQPVGVGVHINQLSFKLFYCFLIHVEIKVELEGEEWISTQATGSGCREAGLETCLAPPCSSSVAMGKF